MYVELKVILYIYTIFHLCAYIHRNQPLVPVPKVSKFLIDPCLTRADGAQADQKRLSEPWCAAEVDNWLRIYHNCCPLVVGTLW